MKNFTQTTLIALLISSSVFSQTKDEPVRNPSAGTIVNQASNNQLILLSPAGGKLFNSSEGSKPVLFRWTAIVPKPKEAVTYRLRVWQLMQGQNGTEAMRSNQPIITKDVVNITQAAISNLYTGPCKPPYLCDFVWAVEVLNSEGNQRYGNSDSYSFKYVGGIGTVTGSGGATIDVKSTDNELENMKAMKVEGGNKGNAGNTGMAGGKSMNADGDSGRKYKSYQPGKPVFGNASQPPAPGESIDKELDKNQPNAKKVDKELDKNQPNAKRVGKELDKGPYSAIKNDGCMNPCCSENAIWIDDKDEKTGAKSSRKAQLKPAALYLPIEKTVYDSNGNISGIMIKTETGELSLVKVIVAGSNSISGGYTMLKTENGEPIIAKVVVAGSHSISGDVK